VITDSSAFRAEKSRERKCEVFSLLWPSSRERIESMDFFSCSITGAFLLLANLLLDSKNLAHILNPLGYSLALYKLKMASLETVSIYSWFYSAQVSPK
jgi:hypothetical protein